MSSISARTDRPSTQLYPYLRNVAADLYNHGFGIIRMEYLADLAIDPDSGFQLEMFRQTCRIISDEKAQNLIIDDQNAVEEIDGVEYCHIVVALAPYGHPGTLNQTYHDELDEHGVQLRETVPFGIAPDEPKLELMTSDW